VRSPLTANATAFAASLSIMAVELVAGRIISRHIGSSLYTWTSVIGVVLAGIALGNWIGGRLADRYPPAKALGAVFLLASICCFSIPPLDQIVAGWGGLGNQEWVLRIAGHTLLLFLAPSTVLGSIGPLAAKMALDLGWQVGRTVGNVYAWGAFGSIVGTFLAGFYLIARLGTVAVLVVVGAAMAAGAMFFLRRSPLPYAWALVGILIYWTAGPRLGLVRQAEDYLFLEESQYSYIAITEEEDPPSARAMTLDHLVHAYVVMDNPTELLYEYENLYAFVTQQAAQDRRRLTTLFIGGGGFIFPRYVLATWPGSYVEVAEIDPRVTEAAHAAFGLPRDTPMRIHNLDARNHIDDLLRRKRLGEPVPAFDFVYGDAYNHYAVPFHLTTLEFLQKIRELMSPQGVYVQNILEVYDSGLFLGAMINTIRQCFPYVYAFSPLAAGPSSDSNRRETFVVAGSLRPLPAQIHHPGNLGSAFRPEHFESLRRRSSGLVLTDDYAPVEQLVAPVIRRARKGI